MELKNYFTFEGRMNRLKYFGIIFLLGIIGAIFSVATELTYNLVLAYINVSFSVIALIINIFVTVQRLHDLKRPGFHYFLTFIPIYNIYFLLYLLFKKGTDGPNEYGADPLVLNYE